jgi:threonine dehydrogenase-like Zn-dependent dehydrogenase
MMMKAVRLHGKQDLRLEEISIPEITDGEILVEIVTDSICMSTYKEAMQGEDHKRVPKDISTQPIIVGHEFCGRIVAVGDKWRHKFKEGDHFGIQPNIKWPGTMNGMGAPGYSYPYTGGDATYAILPNEVMEQDCLLEYDNRTFFYGSLAEPMSCIVAAFKTSYHIQDNYHFNMGIKEGGNLAILAGAGPMGLGAIDYALHNDSKRPGRIVVTDVDENRIARAKSIIKPEDAKKLGIDLVYVNTKDLDDADGHLISLTGSNAGFDDVFIFAPVKAVVEQGDRILAYDGCLNFFAGPTDTTFSASLNFYNIHYLSHHLSGTSGGNTDDMLEAIRLMSSGNIDPAVMITHVGGLDAVVDTTLNLPRIPGGKKLIYTHKKYPLTALEDFATRKDTFSQELALIIGKNDGLWSAEAETYFLEHAPDM